MADWSYANEELREIKKKVALRKYAEAKDLLFNILLTDDFRYLAEQNFKDENLCQNFLSWCNYISFEFVEPNYKDEWMEGTSRGGLYTFYGDFFIAYIIDLEDILSMMIHEYFHHVCDRVLWKQNSSMKKLLTIKEKNFLEDMYINAWIENDISGLSDKWQSILSSHDMFHGLVFSSEEIKWNSLLTSTCLLCHNDLIQLYEGLRKGNKDLFKIKNFHQFATAWIIILNREPKTKAMINNLQINKQEWNYETCTPCETEAKKCEEENNPS